MKKDPTATPSQDAPVCVTITLDPANLPAETRGHLAARATLDNETPGQRLARIITKALGGAESPFTIRPA